MTRRPRAAESAGRDADQKLDATELRSLARFRVVCDFLIEQVTADRALFLEPPSLRA